MELVLEESDVGNWVYKGEGAAIIVLGGYNGSNPHFVGKGLACTIDSIRSIVGGEFEDTLECIIRADCGFHLNSFLQLVAETILISRVLGQLLEAQKLDFIEIKGAIHAYYNVISQHCKMDEDMSVARCDQCFNELARYAPFIVQDEEQKKMKFLKGFRPFFRRFLISSSVNTYREVLSKALALEQNDVEDRKSKDLRSQQRHDQRPDKCKVVQTQYDSMSSKRHRFNGTSVRATRL
ncbi:hypothetical protein GIB67_035757 [Kingdonia uniflora]|uniref:Inositol-pentakisphosphate 2-kinase n=1 Tax=Kingdonia uniflora TaxID=39325 RepID=A0A7J7MJP4_9MAGN|nr:hypothetical protein GIB67_035757 [Kingdonia uniflora]